MKRTILVNELVGGMDMGRYKQVVMGRDHGNAKLTEVEVGVIRVLKGIYSSKKVAEAYCVGAQTIKDIWQGKTWRKA